MGRRTLLLISAFVVAALGTTLIFLYVKGINDRALEGQEPVEILVAASTIAAGTTGDDAAAAGAFEKLTVARDSVADGALSDIDSIKTQVALAPIFPGEQILEQKFGTSGEVATGALPPGTIGLSVNLGDPNRVAQFLQAGSEVAVFLTAPQPTGTPNAGEQATQVLLGRVRVIATGPSTVQTTTVTDPSGVQTEQEFPYALLTLAVSQADAEKIILGQSLGELYFGLLTSDTQVTVGGGIDARSLFN